MTYITRSTYTHPISNRLLASLPHTELEALRPHLTRVRLVTDQVLIERGRAPEHAYFIEEGLASLVAETEHGRLGAQVAMIGREGMDGGLARLDGETAAYACAIMQIPGPALRISTVNLRRCVEHCPELHEVSLRFVQSLTRQIMCIAACNARNSLTERCASWLLMADARMGGGDLPVTHEGLATMLGMRRSGET